MASNLDPSEAQMGGSAKRQPVIDTKSTMESFDQLPVVPRRAVQHTTPAGTTRLSSPKIYPPIVDSASKAMAATVRPME